jgi:hypothetical protein
MEIMKSKTINQNRLWIISINGVLIFLFILFLISIYLDASITKRLSFEFTKEGLDNFITFFSTSIKVGTALMAILTIKLYFSRINQTDKIIERTNLQVSSYIKSENLKNYFLHRKEFRAYFQELDFFKNSITNQSFSFYSVWDTLYRAFYYSTYKNFEPKLDDNAKKAMLNYLNSIKNASINSMVVPAFEEDELKDISNKILPSIEEIVEIITDLEFSEFLKENAIVIIDQNILKLLRLVFKIKITKQLYESILSFDGENIIKLNIFDQNLNEYFQIFKSNNHGK